jgi:hypothetical protein
MKIETSIIARLDGTVIATVPRGVKIVFKADAGRLVADVEDPADLAYLLANADFFPADEADFKQAEQLIRQESGIDDLPDDEGDENAAPVEVATPPKAPRVKKK